MIDMRTAEADYDDTVLIAHVCEIPSVLFTHRDDDDNAITYALVRRPADLDPSSIETDDDDNFPYLVYYADTATHAYFTVADFNVAEPIIHVLANLD